jgi:8-oxo-dGTP pyrophosphatase MutT (NUDIX family)
MTDEIQHRQAFFATLPRKRMAAGALFFDAAGRIYVVKPTYRAGWLVPGGAVEADEAPSAACRREVAEELGIAPPLGRLLCVEYLSEYDGYTESVQFLFDGGVLDAELAAQIQLQASELAEGCFVNAEEASRLLNPKLAVRVAYALDARARGSVYYLEDGQPVGEFP